MTGKKPRALAGTEDERVQAAVVKAGFDVVVASTAAEALPHLRHDSFELVALDGRPDRELLSYIDQLAGKRRRQVFVLKVDEHFTTGDRLQAWSESADLLVHPADLDHLDRLVAEALLERNMFYRCFLEIQRESGARLGAHA